MTDEPMQITPKGETIPLPARDDVLGAFRKVVGGAVAPTAEADDTTDTDH